MACHTSASLLLRAKKPPAQAARLVLRNTSEIATWSAVVAAANCDPGLKPNHPNQRINTPSAAIVRLCPGIAFDWPSLPYLPMRGPRMAAPTSAIQPPTECTMVEPAKSWKVVPNSFHHERTCFTVHQPAAAPGPVPGNGVDQYADEDCVNQIHGELWYVLPWLQKR